MGSKKKAGIMPAQSWFYGHKKDNPIIQDLTALAKWLLYWEVEMLANVENFDEQVESMTLTSCFTKTRKLYNAISKTQV